MKGLITAIVTLALLLIALWILNKIPGLPTSSEKSKESYPQQEVVTEKEELGCPFGEICVPPGKTYPVDIQKGEAFDYCVLRGGFQMTVIDKTNELQEVAEVKYGGEDPIFTIMYPTRIEFTTISAEEGRLVFQKCEAL